MVHQHQGSTQLASNYLAHLVRFFAIISTKDRGEEVVSVFAFLLSLSETWRFCASVR